MASTINAKNTSTGVVITPDASGQLELQTADTTRLTIDVNGDVGIGTASPTFVNANYNGLQVNAPAGTSVKLTNTNSGQLSSDGFELQLTSGLDGYLNLRETGSLVFQTAATERMRITSNGGVAFGGASNFGTSGQVLQSNGDAAPSWVTPAAGGVTSLNGETGAITNTTLYAIGSYITGRPRNNTNYAVNSTLAGSSLYATSPGARWDSSTSQFTAGPNSGLSITAQCPLINTGTWRCVSPAFADGNIANSINGLWVRIS